MAPVLAVDEPFIRQKGHQMRKDPCYLSYAEALQCLDKNDFQQQLCTREFLAFKACRRQQSAAADDSRMKFHENDPILGWAFRLYNNWTAEQEDSKKQNSSSSSRQPEYRRWRPPPEDRPVTEVRPVSSSVGNSSADTSTSSETSTGSGIASVPSIPAGSSSSNSSSSGSLKTNLRASENNPLWGWASRWYDGHRAVSDDNASNNRDISPDASSSNPQQRQRQ